MKILISGASGFLGYALGRRLFAEGWQVRGAVRSLSDKKRLPQGVEIFPIGSVGPDTVWTASLSEIDIVVHLAARTHVTNETAEDPSQAYRDVNVKGTERLARVAAASGVKRFIFLSSVKVNGEGRLKPYTELDPPAPENPYGISKWEAEQVLHNISGETGMEIVIIRPPLVYGPGVKANFLELMKIIRRGIPLPFASVNNRRSVIYLENLIDAIFTVCIHPEAKGQTYLVSDGIDISTPDLIRRTADALGTPARLFSFPVSILLSVSRILGKNAAIERLCGSLAVDSSKIAHDLGWKAPYTVESGLAVTAAWYERHEFN